MNVSAIASLEFITRLTLIPFVDVAGDRNVALASTRCVQRPLHDYVLLGLLACRSWPSAECRSVAAYCRCRLFGAAISGPAHFGGEHSAPLTNIRRVEMPDSGERHATQVAAADRRSSGYAAG